MVESWIDLESNDSNSVATVLSRIYDKDESEKFLGKLESRILHHDQEIEKMCSANYKSFIDCIQELLQVRPNAERLKRETMDINSELLKSTDIIQRKAEELIKARRILVNSSSSIELLKKCLFVLEQYTHFNDQLQERKYFPALKTLESLERDHLPTVSSYRFAQNMCKEIPKFRQIIKNDSKDDLNNFLEGLLVKSQMIGDIILKRGEHEHHELEIGALSSIDFGPVYRGLHIFTNLGFREQFDEYYREQRQKQSRLAFKPPMNMSKSISAYQDYFSSIIGFFVIEDHLMATTKNFIHIDYLNGLWQDAIQSIKVSLKKHAKECDDASLMLKIKNLMMLFTFTIRNYGHNTDGLGEILITIREQYNEILMNQWRNKFQEIFRQDSYHPLEVKNNEEYLQAIGALSFFETDSDFPKKFPFSSFVPKVYEEVKNFIEQSLKFSQDLNSSQSDVENMVKKSTNQLLTQTLSSCLTELINDSSLKFSQLIQITINTNYLEDAMQFLDDHITYQVSKSISLDNSQTDTIVDNTQIQLQGKSMFIDARAEAESQIYKKLNDQIDEFLSLACYDWTIAEPTGQASSFITDLLAFLEGTFIAFTNLPERVTQRACMSACRHIAQSLRDILLSDDVKALSLGGLQQFNLDLMQCEFFKPPVEGIDLKTLHVAFEELRQLCDLFLCEDYSTYMTDLGKKTNKYIKVTTATALTVVDKLRENDRKKSVFTLKNDKQKLRNTFAKNLRQVIQNQQSIQNQQYQPQ